jgi:hypothetical protein
MATPGTKVLIHEKKKRGSCWDPHGVEGWCLGPALEHYRCYQVFANKTKAARIDDTVEFFPAKTKIPYLTPTDIAIQASQVLIRVLLHQQKPSTPLAHIGYNQLEAIQQIAHIFNSRIRTHEPAGTSKTPHKNAATLPRVIAPKTKRLPRVLPLQS